MSGRRSGLPDRGERVIIRWPGGLYDFVMEFHYLDDSHPTPPDGWFNVHGAVLEPEQAGRRARTFYARQLARLEFELIPKRD